MSSHNSARIGVPGHGYQPQQSASDSADTAWTPERCLAMYQTTNDRYWADHGLRMNHSGGPSQASMSSAGQLQHTSMTGYYPSTWSYQMYVPLPQEPYVATRRYQPQDPIVFRISPAVGYVRLADFYPSYTTTSVSPLEGGEDTVFSEDNLSQKQSIRLQVRVPSVSVSNSMPHSRSNRSMGVDPTRSRSMSETPRTT